MHQTVRQFFLRPRDVVCRSPFQVVANVQQSRMMIQTTCVRYLNVHYQEIVNKLAGDWRLQDSSPEGFHKFVQYFDTRPFIKYSLEYLTRHRSDIGSDNLKLLLGLTSSLESSPPSPAFCLLKRLVNSSSDYGNVQKQMNHLLGVSAENGCVVAIGNLLEAGAQCDSMNEYKCPPLHSAVRMGHEATARLFPRPWR